MQVPEEAKGVMFLDLEYKVVNHVTHMLGS